MNETGMEEKKSGLFQRFVDFINKDTTVSNESVKVLVVIRLLNLSILAYFVVNLAIVGHVLDSRGVLLSMVFIGGFCGLFALSYKLRVRAAVWVFSLAVVAFIFVNLRWFGWWIGVQHFLIVILVLEFFIGYERFAFKMIIAAVICMVRIMFYYNFHSAHSIYNVPEYMNDLLQILNTMVIFWCLSVISYVFSKTSRQMEGKLVKYNEQLEKEALTDKLTDLTNRRGGLEYVRKKLEEENCENFSLCMCDIDFFKKVNDTWGHDCGDIVLKEISAIFKKYMKSPKLPCRWGGEEFLLLFPGMNGDEAQTILCDIQDAIRAMVVHHENDEIKVTMTFGLTEYDFRKTIDDAIQEADEKLYYGKKHGRDQIVF